MLEILFKNLKFRDTKTDQKKEKFYKEFKQTYEKYMKRI